MTIISQNDNSGELKKLKLETNFNTLQYSSISIGECFSYKNKLYIKVSIQNYETGIETAVCLESGWNDEKFFADTQVFPVDAVVLTD